MPLPLTTRRRFLCQCAAGLAFAPGARLLAQSSKPTYLYTGIRWQKGSVNNVPADTYLQLTLTMSLNGRTRLDTYTLNGPPPASGPTEIPERAVDFPPITGGFGTWLLGVTLCRRSDGLGIAAGGVPLNANISMFPVPITDARGMRIACPIVGTETVLINAGKTPEFYHYKVRLWG